MAYDKVIDSSVLDAGLKQIADAIREKGGTTDSLAFPAAMANAIAAIEAGGGGVIWGTVTPENYTNELVVGPDILDDNCVFLIANISATYKTSSSYIDCGYFVAQDGVISGQMRDMNRGISMGAIPNTITVDIDKNAGKVTFNLKFSSGACYLYGGTTYVWCMGALV